MDEFDSYQNDIIQIEHDPDGWTWVNMLDRGIVISFEHLSEYTEFVRSLYFANDSFILSDNRRKDIKK